MSVSGRSYILSAATLLFLAAALKVYDDFSQTPEGQEVLREWRVAICEKTGIDSGNMRFGCHATDIKTIAPDVQVVVRRGTQTGPDS